MSSSRPSITSRTPAGPRRSRNAFPVYPITSASVRRPNGRRAGQSEQGADLTEIVTRGRDAQPFLAATGQFADDIEFAFADNVDEVAHRALLEKHRARC